MTSKGAAIVTGGSGAIGQALCKRLARDGFDIAFTYLANDQSAAVTTRAVEGLGRQVGAFQVDLRDPDAVEQTIKQAARQFDGIRALVHASGPSVPQRFVSTIDPIIFQQHVELELLAFFNATHPCLPYLRESQGSITAVTTVAIRRFPVRDGLSAGPKAGIEALIRALAKEEGRNGIRANCVAPGILSEGMARRLRELGELTHDDDKAAMSAIPLRRFGNASDIAAAVGFLASSEAGYITGQIIDVDGGYSV